MLQFPSTPSERVRLGLTHLSDRPIPTLGGEKAQGPPSGRTHTHTHTPTHNLRNERVSRTASRLKRHRPDTWTGEKNSFSKCVLAEEHSETLGVSVSNRCLDPVRDKEKREREGRKQIFGT
ncbi:hypothetical protein Mapa_007251 [Marchantia paleacea]|nr:hypothetical protein Mapa_007251 [Marchantia paleacea]